MSNVVNVTETSNSVVVVESDNSVTVTSPGPQGIQGPTGPQGAIGPQGATGPGVAAGGATDDLLVKQSGVDYDTAWSDEIKVDQLDFDTAAGETLTAAGQMTWDADVDTIDVLLRNGTATPTLMHIGQDEYFYVKASSAITRGQVVHYTGTDGASGHILAAPFLADGTYESKTVIGVATQDADTGEFVHVLWRGKLRSFDTSLLTPGILYASTTVAGGFQSTAPTAPNNIVTVAVAVNQKNNGTILVRPTFAGSLAESEDVDVSAPSDGDVLTYSSSTEVWEGVSRPALAGDSAFTSQYAPLSATLTVASSTNTTGSRAGLPNTFFVGAGNRNFAPSSLFVWPFAVTSPIIITDWLVDIRFNSSVNTETMRAGIYNFNGDYSLGSLVLEFPILTVPTGTGLYVTSLGSSLNLSDGLYAVAWNLSSANLYFRTPQAMVGVHNMQSTNTIPARFQSGINGTVNIANPLPSTPSVPTLTISTDSVSWGPVVSISWTYS